MKHFNPRLLPFLLVFLAPGMGWAQFGGPLDSTQLNNGVMDGLQEMVTEYEVMIPISDGTRLATDVFLPIISDDLALENIEFDLGITTFRIPRLKLAEKGHQLYEYPGQRNPDQLPIIFTRTPYSKRSPEQGQIISLLGYAAVVQDMRGRYRSEGVYLPMYSDSWPKEAYFDSAFHHPLDTTTGGTANRHQDGYESVQYLVNELRWDSNGDGRVDTTDALVCNGDMGMFGASALGNTQFQAAAVQPVDPNARGLKCLLPIVASGEFYHGSGHHNGVFRQSLIDGWLRGQIEPYDYEPNSLGADSSIFNTIHSLGDYGGDVLTDEIAAERAIDFWTTMGAAHYPDSPFRAIMDISAARLDRNGAPDLNGPNTRYAGMRVPAYNLSGWWDIFVDGQLQTWQLMRQHLPTDFRGQQKLVIGPWAHQTIGGRNTGDMQGPYAYPENVGDIIGVSLDNLDQTNLGGVGRSEVISWYRNYLGEPEVVLPAQNEWQIADLGFAQGEIMLPAEEYRIPFNDFFNFINGSGPLPNFPIRVRGVPLVDSTTVQRISIPATGTSLIGDESNARLEADRLNFNDNDPDGVAPIRFYVVGPVNDGVPENADLGNYWFAADTFPLQSDVSPQTLYLHQDGSFNQAPIVTDEGARSYLNDPQNPVPTHGGPNMITRTPDDARSSQGQMDFADPQYRELVLDRAQRPYDGERYSDLLQFESEAILDSFCFIGAPVASIPMKALPIDTRATDSVNFDVVVRILDVTPDGRELYVQEGACNLRARDYAASWADGQEDPSIPFTNGAADSVYTLRFRMLPIAYTFGKGHKIKVLVSSSNYPRYQACPNLPLEDGDFFRTRPDRNDTYTFHGETLKPRPNLQTMVFTPEQAPSIEFPVYGKQYTSRAGVQQQANQVSLLTYPNPASEVLTVAVDKPGPYRLRLLNLMGQTLKRRSFQTQLRLDVADLPRGVVFVEVSKANSSFRQTKRVILR